jgi:triosephosphate isomerase (TIM)
MLVYMQRKLLIDANWKMNPVPAGALEHDSSYQSHAAVDVMVFPTFLDIPACREAKLITGAQCGHWEKTGAHTGDVSMQMIAETKCRSVLCGHSDRRGDHAETNEEVIEQVIAALEENLHPILCVGETEKERDAGKQEDVVRAQLVGCPFEREVTIAYEPVWAISQGDPNKPAATTEDAQEMHAFIRSLIPEGVRETVRIIYGGSMKPENAEELLKQPDIDGGLVGGAALDPEAFGKIVEIAAGLSE